MSVNGPQSRNELGDAHGADRLDSWKEIAAYLKRVERTVRRWEEKDGLPVHRHQHKSRAAIFAYKSELDAWWNNGQRLEDRQVPRASRKPHLVWLLGLAAAVAAAGSLIFFRYRVPATSPTLIPWIAVLPLENLSGDPQQEYFADGLTETLITDLGKISALRVISRTSVMQYKGTKKPISEIARELKVDALVEGAVMRSGERVRITAQLIEAPTDRHLWAESYDRDLHDVLALQAEVAQAIAREVKATVSVTERQRFTHSHRVEPGAYEAYLKGRYHWNKRTSEGFQKAADLFNEAIRIDPDFAPAYVGLADTYAIWYYSPLPIGVRLSHARDAATHALLLDESLAEAHNSRAYLFHRFEWDWAGAEAEFKRALQLNGGYTTAHQWYALFLASMGRFDEATAEARFARDLDPVSPAARATLGRAYYFARRFPEAIQQFQAALELDDNFSSARFDLARVYALTGKAQEGAAEIQRVITQNGTNASFLAELGYAYAKAGRAREARAALAEVQKRRVREHVAPATMAWLFAGLGEYDQAIRWLQREYSEQGNYLPFINTDPSLDGLRSQPHFQELLAKLRFPNSPATPGTNH